MLGRWKSLLVFLVLILAVPLFIGATKNKSAKSPEWSMNASLIEACSCPMFCQCYFNPEPAVHPSHASGIHEIQIRPRNGGSQLPVDHGLTAGHAAEDVRDIRRAVEARDIARADVKKLETMKKITASDCPAIDVVDVRGLAH